MIPAWCLHASETRVRTGEHDPDDVFRDVAQKMGFTIEEMTADLALLPNSGDEEFSYDDWVNVLAGIYHETDGSPEGRDLALEWSERSLKHDAEKFTKSWTSLNIDGKDKAPVTFRFAHKHAQEKRKTAEAATVKDLKQRIADTADVGALRAVAADVKRTDMDPLFRTDLTNAIRARYKAFTGDLLPVSQARDMVRYEAPNAKEIPEWLQPWVYCTQDDRFYRRRSFEAITARAFNGLNNVHMLSRQEKLEGRAMPETTASDAAQNRYEIPKVHGRMYLPGEDEIFTFQGSDWLNTFFSTSQPAVPETLTPADRAAIRLVDAHFDMLVPDPRERALVQSWLAYIVQELKRPNWAICMQGPEANGKSFIGSMMGAVLGSENVRIMFAQTIQESPFNSWAEGSLLNVIEEVKQHSQNRHTILDRLQVPISNNVVEIHKKNMSPYNAWNTAGYLLLTNHRDAIPIGAGDTRYFMTASRHQTPWAVEDFKTANPDYFNRLFDLLNSHAGALRHWLLNYPISPEFNPVSRAPKSQEHDHAVDLARSDSHDAIRDLIQVNGHPALSLVLLDATLLAEKLSEDGTPAPHPRAIHQTLLSLGFHSLGRFRVNGSEKRRFWSTTPEVFSRDVAYRQAQIVTKLDPCQGL